MIGSSSFLQVMRKTKTSQMCLKFGQIGLRTAELAVLERLEKSPWTYNGKNVVTTLGLSNLIESSSFLQVMGTCIKLG